MNKEAAVQFRHDLAEILINTDKNLRRDDLSEMRTWPEYHEARKIVHPSLQSYSKSLEDSSASQDLLAANTDAVFSPLLTLEKPFIDLTDEERLQIWAHLRLTEYEAMPKGTKAETKLAGKFARSIAQELLQSPYSIEVAGAIWMAYGQRDSDTSEIPEFVEKLISEAVNVAKKEWHQISPDQLAKIVSIYAHSQLSSEIARSFLKGYFEGPSSMHSSAEAMYTFARAQLKLLDDNQALEAGLKIGNCCTDIFTVHSRTYQQYALARITGIDDDDLLTKALSADIVLLDLCSLTSSGDEDFMHQIMEYGKTIEWQDKILARLRRVRSRLGEQTYLEKAEKLNQMTQLSIRRSSIFTPAARSFFREWPYNLLEKEDNILMSEYENIVGSQAMISRAIRQTLQSMESPSDNKPFRVTIEVSEGLFLDLAISDVTARRDLAKILSIVKKLNPNMELIRDSVLNQSSRLVAHAVTGKTKYNNHDIVYVLRSVSPSEANTHPISALESIGIPSTATQEELVEENRRLTREIHSGQIRFLNRRGFRIPIQHRQFKEFGYQAIDFRRNADDPHVIDVTYHVAGISFHVRLDRNLNFDFEGKRFTAASIKESLHHATLSLLYPLLCQERLRDDTQESAELETEVISRVGHLRLLPLGKRYTQRAVNLCWEKEQRDLIIIDHQRKLNLGTNQYTTYVQPTIEKEEGLPPIVINFPNAIQSINAN